MKNDFRRDLHQILGYASFSEQTTQYGILCYPSINSEYKETKLYNPLTQTETIIYLYGIPLDTRKLFDIKKLMYKTIRLVEQNLRTSSGFIRNCL